ncbi:MAG: LpqB family beta-propeller domain-containing protein [Protaetiibacter sp.]
MMRRNRMLLGGVLATALVLAGCAGIPTGGSVGTFAIGDDTADDKLLTLADGPQDGQSPAEILAGFLAAQRAPQNNYGTARLFLADEFRNEWMPTALVRVSDSPMVSQPDGGDDRLRIDASVQAVVDASGVYTELQRAELQALDYQFARDDRGEWRISAAPEGTVISSRGFERSFVAYPLYFFDPSGTALVPDVRWFPDTSARAERIVRQLLAGPAPWYQNGVLITSFPTGTKLESDGVTVERGTATVALPAETASQDADTRWRMQQQLRLSLSALGEVKAVQMTAGGFPIEVSGGRTAESSFLAKPDPLGLAEGGFGYLTASTVDPVPGISDAVQQLGPLGATLGRDAQAAAVRTAQGVWLVTAGEAPVLVDARAGLIDPSIDARGFVWTAVGNHADSIRAIDSAGGVHEMPAPNLDGTILAAKVSRDGARLLIATQGVGGPALTIAGIVRDGDGVPTGFGDPLSLPIASTSLVDAGWVDSSTVAALSRDDDETRVDLYRIGGRHELAGRLPGGVQLVGGNFADGMRVRDAEGAVWRRNSSGGWQSTGIVASFLATQQ